MLAWLYLVVAILMEVGGTTAMKLSDGLTRPVPVLVMVGCYAAAFVGLALALKQMEVGIAYALWSGVGTAVIAVIGVAFLGESLSVLKVVSVGFIVLGVTGLGLASGQ